jgi:hypothetical protein
MSSIGMMRRIDISEKTGKWFYVCIIKFSGMRSDHEIEVKL